MNEVIRYKGDYGTIYEEVTYNEYLPSLMQTTIYTGDVIPTVGEEIYLSSCDIPYHNNWRNCWTTKPEPDDIFADVVIRLIEYDDSDYDWRKGRNGGSYLTSTWEIVEVKNIVTYEDM